MVVNAFVVPSLVSAGIDFFEKYESLSAAALAWLLGVLAVYSAMFGTGYVLYGRVPPGAVLLAVAVTALLVVRIYLEEQFELRAPERTRQ